MLMSLPDFCILQVSDSKTLRQHGFQVASTPNKEFVYPTAFNPLPYEKDLLAIQHAVAVALQPIINDELVIAQRPESILCPAEKEHLIRCGLSRLKLSISNHLNYIPDFCAQAILFNSLFCSKCGIELCLTCHNAKRCPKGEYILT